jgi:hypothetical protein
MVENEFVYIGKDDKFFLKGNSYKIISFEEGPNGNITITTEESLVKIGRLKFDQLFTTKLNWRINRIEYLLGS